MMEAANGKKTVDAIVRTFKKEGYTISTATAKDIRNVYTAAAALPTEYFEAKPQRVVGPDEWLAVVAPNNSGKNLFDELSHAGVNVLAYEAGNEADRLAKVNSIDGARFSRKGKSAAEIQSMFADRFDRWIASGKKDAPGSGRFLVGRTGEALRSIGVKDYDIYLSTAKTAKITREHPGMTEDVIKQVPDILDNPIIVMQSQTVDADGKPVLAAVELSPQNKQGEVMDFAVVASVYGKNGAQQLIDSSDILYVDENKKRTDNWLKLLRLQLPSRITNYGSIDSISLVSKDVNGIVTSGESGKTAMQVAFEAAMQERAAEELKSIRETGKTIQGIREENTLLEEKLKEATKEAKTQRARAEKWKGETNAINKQIIKRYA